ncbi:MAG: hypothetical protein EXS55_01800 [Candidatus Magasanikbacteria bacterium]|nr:hypothetical protein [Candidatus Magasanikbacteria bacterium]
MPEGALQPQSEIKTDLMAYRKNIEAKLAPSLAKAAEEKAAREARLKNKDMAVSSVSAEDAIMAFEAKQTREAIGAARERALAAAERAIPTTAELGAVEIESGDDPFIEEPEEPAIAA